MPAWHYALGGRGAFEAERALPEAATPGRRVAASQCGLEGTAPQPKLAHRCAPASPCREAGHGRAAAGRDRARAAAIRGWSGLGSQIVEVFLHDEGKEGAEYMAADGGIGGMVDGPCPHDCLGAAEQVFDLQEIAVAQHCLTRRDPRIGAEHEDAVETRLFCELAGVDLEGGLAPGLLGLAQIAAVGGIADQRLVAALQLLLQARYDGLAILAVFFGLSLVAADDI